MAANAPEVLAGGEAAAPAAAAPPAAAAGGEVAENAAAVDVPWWMQYTADTPLVVQGAGRDINR